MWFWHHLWLYFIYASIPTAKYMDVPWFRITASGHSAEMAISLYSEHQQCCPLFPPQCVLSFFRWILKNFLLIWSSITTAQVFMSYKKLQSFHQLQNCNTIFPSSLLLWRLHSQVSILINSNHLRCSSYWLASLESSHAIFDHIHLQTESRIPTPIVLYVGNNYLRIVSVSRLLCPLH